MLVLMIWAGVIQGEAALGAGKRPVCELGKVDYCKGYLTIKQQLAVTTYGTSGPSCLYITPANAGGGGKLNIYDVYEEINDQYTVEKELKFRFYSDEAYFVSYEAKAGGVNYEIKTNNRGCS
ncbi:MAG: hypothetical protein F6K38_16055 [Moorea sp. SIO3B2]|nr:hypothetical protein [Moorena sp. SIO3B2]